MYFFETLRGLWRRWYVVLPGMLIATLLAIAAWNLIPPGYERSSTQLLIPAAGSIPAGANPYLFLGGLAPAADVLVRAVGSENLLNEVTARNPGVKIEVSRDTGTAGPVILIMVTAPTNAVAAEVQGMLIERTATVLDELQASEGIAAVNRLTVLPVTVADQSVLQERNRFIGVGAVGFVGLTMTLLIAGLVDGLGGQRKRSVPNDKAQARPALDGTAKVEHENAATTAPVLQESRMSRSSERSSRSSGRSTGLSEVRDQPRHDSDRDTASSTLSNPR